MILNQHFFPAFRYKVWILNFFKVCESINCLFASFRALKVNLIFVHIPSFYKIS